MTDPSLTLPHSLALTPWYTHLKHWHSPQGLVAPQVPDNANLVPARAGGNSHFILYSQSCTPTHSVTQFLPRPGWKATDLSMVWPSALKVREVTAL